MNEDLRSALNSGTIIPVHLQLSPTNKCNKVCSFCCFADRDKNLSLSLPELKDIFKRFKDMGTKAVTVSGGGEPLCHPQINELLVELRREEMKVGLMTNGLLLEKLARETSDAINWLRISLSDDMTKDKIDQMDSILEKVVPERPKTNFSFSYVVTKDKNPEIQEQAIAMAQKYNFSNVRFTPDLYCADEIDMSEVPSSALTVIDAKNLAAVRDTDVGKNCYIAYARPFLAADGYVYPCAHNKEARLCHYTEFQSRLKTLQPFNPDCKVCYCNGYNMFLENALSTIGDMEFI